MRKLILCFITAMLLIPHATGKDPRPVGAPPRSAGLASPFGESILGEKDPKTSTPSGNTPPTGAVVELLEDDADRFVPKLDRIATSATGKPTEASLSYKDVFTGSSCLKLEGIQRFADKIPNWKFRITEKPREGEYRYLRFAWKIEKDKEGLAGGVMVQLHANNSWEHRYHAGEKTPNYRNSHPSKQVNAKPPLEWEVVTIDLYANHKTIEITGLALTVMHGTALFDHMYLGRTIEDLDKVTNAATKWAREKAKIDDTRFQQLWKDLASQDASVYTPAQWELASNPADALKHLKGAIKIDDGKGHAEKIAKLLLDLDAKKFTTRELAQMQLANMGPEILPFLIAARNPKNTTDFEVRLEALISEFRSQELRAQEYPEWGIEDLRKVRAIRALEQSGSKDAKPFLEQISKSVMGKGIPREARISLSRMK